MNDLAPTRRTTGPFIAYPRLNRSGLGNLLITWARAEIFARQQQAPILQPQWTQPKIGPLLRRESDLRYYLGLFKRDTFVGGLKKKWILATHPRVPEAEYDQVSENPTARPTVVEFTGLTGMFEPLLDHRDFLKKRIAQIASPVVHAEVAAEPADYDVACHVRRGDIPLMTPGETVIPWVSNKAQPDSWFLAGLDGISKKLGRPPRVRIFSDGSAKELAALLQRPATQLARPKSALADILCLAKAPVLLTTGGSSFSGWGAFLGDNPSVWYPPLLQHLHPDRPKIDIASDTEGNIPDRDLENICNLINDPPGQR